ncbi:MAG: hypothetical protein IRZ00_17005 [Gemmatimonadetes bacterium]|nr:hypothetical protein [Gemmatimonadota bacterium]
MTAPGAAELAALPVHVVARDYPESLAVFHRLGVDVPRRGGAPVAEALGGDAGPLLDALLEATRWRDRYRGPCGRGAASRPRLADPCPESPS